MLQAEEYTFVIVWDFESNPKIGLIKPFTTDRGSGRSDPLSSFLYHKRYALFVSRKLHDPICFPGFSAIF